MSAYLTELLHRKLGNILNQIILEQRLLKMQKTFQNKQCISNPATIIAELILNKFKQPLRTQC